MQRSSLPLGVSTLKKWKEEKGTLKCTLPYQRHAGMWNSITKSMLIWAILADSYLPPIVLLKNEDGKDDKGKTQYTYQILDGLQRLTTIFDFMDVESEFKLHASTPEVEVDGTAYDLAGFSFKELSAECQDRIANYRFSVQCIENYSSEEAEMLFFNINSGVALSTIQKSKPKLGEIICSYIRDVLEKPFFSQAINITTNQALKEDDFCLVLQSIMLLDEKYDEYKSISTAECLKYTEKLRNTFSRGQQDSFTDIVEFLGVFQSKAKYLRKNNVPIIAVLAEQAIMDDIEAGCFKAFLDEFFDSESEAYKEYSGSGNVKRVNVEGRIRVLTEAYRAYFSVSDSNSEDSSITPTVDDNENSEENSTDLSLIEEPSENNDFPDNIFETGDLEIIEEDSNV